MKLTSVLAVGWIVVGLTSSSDAQANPKKANFLVPEGAGTKEVVVELDNNRRRVTQEGVVNEENLQVEPIELNGTGVNGGGAMAPELLATEREDSLLVPNITDDQDAQTQMERWCSYSVGRLGPLLARAFRLYERKSGAIQEATKLLRDELQYLDQTDFGDDRRDPMTRRLISRAVVIDKVLTQRIRAGFIPKGGRTDNARFLLMADLVQYIIDTESNFDRPYFLETIFRGFCFRDSCRSAHRPFEFFRRLLANATGQFSLKNSTFRYNGRSVIHTSGAPEVYLTAAEFLSAYVAYDLSDPRLPEPLVSCAIPWLRDLSHRLTLYNLGNEASEWLDKKDAVNATFYSHRGISNHLEYLANSIEHETYFSCPYTFDYWNGRYE